MSDIQPTKEQIKEFWELCGLVEQPTGSWYVNKVGGEYVHSEIPPIDLNNLFEYAIPKLIEIYRISIDMGSKGSFVHIFKYGEDYSSAKYQHKDIVFALFWVLWEVLHDK